MLFGCGGADHKIYADKSPLANFKTFYSQDVVGYGFYKNRGGEVSSRYYVHLIPNWNGNTGKLVEYNYDDAGKMTTRDWTVTPARRQAFYRYRLRPCRQFKRRDERLYHTHEL